MQSPAARREEIQKRLQLLKDEQEREQKALEELAVAHPELSVEELKERARELAKANAPTSLEVAGATVRVDDYVSTLDDPALLSAAERGVLVTDPVKRVYLGERGKVIRVMPRFQSKPAVELRFADGAEKIFLAECLDVGEQATKAKASAASGKKKTDKEYDGDAGGAPAQQKKTKENEGEKQEEPSPVTVPSWNDLALPRRGHRPAGAGSSASSPSLIPPPPSKPPVDVPTPKPAEPAGAPPAGTTSAKASVALKQPPQRPRREPASATPESAPPAASSAPVAPPVPPVPPVRPHQAMGLVKEALSDPPSQRLSPGAEELGRPSAMLFTNPQGLPKDSPEMDDLAKTPRPDFLEVVPLPQTVAPCQVEKSQVPTRCPANYEAKFPLGDEKSHIPRYAPTKPVHVRRCQVAGYGSGEAPVTPLEFKQVTFRQDVSTLEAALAIISRELKWNRPPNDRARRLFTEAGQEIMWPEAIVDGMRLVATAGVGYSGSVAASHRPAASPSPSPAASTPIPASASTGTATNRSSPAPRAPVGVSTASSARGPYTVSKEPPATTTPRRTTPRQAKPVKPPRPEGKTPVAVRPHTAPVPPVPRPTTAPKGRSSIIHVCVYENGNYDADKYDRVYRTVTIRPTYKTLSSVKVLITRELEWRDGRKVDMLFDATGMEITDLSQLSDGASIVASAGDRFVVPYPNSNLHREALRLAGSQ